MCSLRSRHSNRDMSYWRDKSRREIDFMIPRSAGKYAESLSQGVFKH